MSRPGESLPSEVVFGIRPCRTHLGGWLVHAMSFLLNTIPLLSAGCEAACELALFPVFFRLAMIGVNGGKRQPRLKG